MEKKKNTKTIIAWFMLILLMVMLLGLNYVKFFMASNQHIEEQEVENSSAQAIHTALEQIVTNFNKNTRLNFYQEQGITMKATLNNYSIFISYVTDTTITYEFSYHDLFLNINIENKSENKEKFNAVLDVLIRAVQERIGGIEDIDSYINSFLDDSEEYDGLYKEADDEIVTYHMDITKKLKRNGSYDSSTINDTVNDEANKDNE